MNISEIRSNAAKSRWGESIGKTKQIRVSTEAFNALQTIPEKDRRRISTEAILKAVETYKKTSL